MLNEILERLQSDSCLSSSCISCIFRHIFLCLTKAVYRILILLWHLWSIDFTTWLSAYLPLSSSILSWWTILSRSCRVISCSSFLLPYRAWLGVCSACFLLIFLVWATFFRRRCSSRLVYTCSFWVELSLAKSRRLPRWEIIRLSLIEHRASSLRRWCSSIWGALWGNLTVFRKVCSFALHSCSPTSWSQFSFASSGALLLRHLALQWQ